MGREDVDRGSNADGGAAADGGANVRAGRRDLLRGVGGCAVVALAGCSRSSETAAPTGSSTPESESVHSERPCPETDDAPTTPADTPDPVLVDDLVVQNVDDADHRITIAVSRDGTTVFEDSFDALGDGGGRRVERPVFEEPGTYEVVVTVGDESTGYTTRTEVDVHDSYWRQYNGVRVSVDGPRTVEAFVLHGDPAPTVTPTGVGATPTDCRE